MFGHYDNAGYPNMYTGPTNGGVFPMTNAIWGTVVINGETRAQCPLSATRQGLDGRAIKGHVDDYWVQYGSSLPDPFIGNWTEHTKGECTGDYMGTNQSSLSNKDGSTRFWYYPDGSPIYDYTGSEPSKRDGCHGMRLFVESRGYTVDTNYSQYIYGYNGNTNGFAFANFKSEIDAGRPVLIQVEGHTMLGYGYNDTGSTIYIHDTWDYDDHEMTWGGSYSDMEHYGVSVIQISGGSSTTTTTTTPTTTTTTTTCPPCPASGIITNVTYPAGYTCSCSNATSISLGANVTVESGATVTFTAPTITVEPGFHAETGAVVNMKQP
jgi:hypothetical protein